MAGLRDLLNGGKDHGEANRKIAAALKKEFPLVAEILGGLPENGKSPAIPGSAITIYIREGKACFSTNVKAASVTLYGGIADILNPWGCINSVILLGEVSSKGYTEPVSKLTKEQESLLL